MADSIPPDIVFVRTRWESRFLVPEIGLPIYSSLTGGRTMAQLFSTRYADTLSFAMLASTERTYSEAHSDLENMEISSAVEFRQELSDILRVLRNEIQKRRSHSSE